MKALLVAALCLFAGAAAAQVGPPTQVLNQGLQAIVVAPSDGVILSLGPSRALYNGNATVCNISVILMSDSAAVTFNNVQPGEFLPIRAKTVQNTGTSCTNILALY